MMFFPDVPSGIWKPLPDTAASELTKVIVVAVPSVTALIASWMVAYPCDPICTRSSAHAVLTPASSIAMNVRIIFFISFFFFYFLPLSSGSNCINYNRSFAISRRTFLRFSHQNSQLFYSGRYGDLEPCPFFNVTSQLKPCLLCLSAVRRFVGRCSSQRIGKVEQVEILAQDECDALLVTFFRHVKFESG